jgi:2-oxoglutarate ferredoxin oxidoreductase subunit delta
MGTLPESDPKAAAQIEDAAPGEEAAHEKKTAAGRKPRGRVFINEERCKGCGLCIAFCPSHVLVRSEKFNSKGYHPPEDNHPENCTGCDICGYFCPDFAIYGVRITDKEQNKEEKKP